MNKLKLAVAALSIFLLLSGCQNSTTDNKEVIQKWVTELNQSNLGHLKEVLHEDFVDHNPLPGVPGNKAGFIGMLTNSHRNLFPGIQVKIEDMVAEEDKVSVRMTVKAKHVGTVLGAVGTGKELTWNAYAIYRLKDGQVVDRWKIIDSYGFLSQIGVAKVAQ